MKRRARSGVQGHPVLPGMPRPAFGGVLLAPGFDARKGQGPGRLDLFKEAGATGSAASEMRANGATGLFDEGA